MGVQRHLVVDLGGLILRFKPYRDAFVVQHALVRLADGEYLRSRLAMLQIERASVDGHAVHEYLQAVLVGLVHDFQVVTEVLPLMGGGKVGAVEYHVGFTAGRYVGHGDALRPVLARQRDLQVGVLHARGAVAQGVLARLVVFGLLLRLVGVVRLPAEEAEDVAPSRRRLIDIYREVGVAVAVAELIREFGEVRLVLVVVALCLRVLPAVLRVYRELGLELCSGHGVLAGEAALDDGA